MTTILFPSKRQIIALHDHLCDLFGGSLGLRDEGLLDSAIETPQSGFGNEYFHQFPFEMAAAYLFHLVKNHPFIDGNKRIGFATAHVFLDLNGYELEVEEDEGVEFTLAVAAGEITNKQEIAIFLEQHCVKQ